MAAARMSRHLFISFIFDHQSGEKDSNTEYLFKYPKKPSLFAHFIELHIKSEID